MSKWFSLAVPALLLAVSAHTLGGEAQDEKELKKLPGDSDKALQLRINAAVRKGMEHLIGLQEEDGSWKGEWAKRGGAFQFPIGETALTLLALLKGGTHRDEECIKKGFGWMRTRPLQKTYDVGVLLMALEARWAQNRPAPTDRKDLTRAVRKRVRVPSRDLEWVRECVAFLLSKRVASKRLLGMKPTTAQGHADVWSYPMANTVDHSNTQFALLGLKSASKCGILIPPDVWVRTVEHFLEMQEKQGPPVRRWRFIEDKDGYVRFSPRSSVPDRARGWAYSGYYFPSRKANKFGATTGSMTCVGVSSLAIALSELGPRCPEGLGNRGRRAIHDGIAWLANDWAIDRNPNHPEKAWHYYYLYGLERVGVLTWTRGIGKHDWYREGAEYLVAHQQAGGAWDDPGAPGTISDTCFAVLFLTRATVPGRSVVTDH